MTLGWPSWSWYSINDIWELGVCQTQQLNWCQLVWRFSFLKSIQRRTETFFFHTTMGEVNWISDSFTIPESRRSWRYFLTASTSCGCIGCALYLKGLSLLTLIWCLILICMSKVQVVIGKDVWHGVEHVTHSPKSKLSFADWGDSFMHVRCVRFFYSLLFMQHSHYGIHICQYCLGWNDSIMICLIFQHDRQVAVCLANWPRWPKQMDFSTVKVTAAGFLLSQFKNFEKSSIAIGQKLEGGELLVGMKVNVKGIKSVWANKHLFLGCRGGE